MLPWRPQRSLKRVRLVLFTESVTETKIKSKGQTSAERREIMESQRQPGGNAPPERAGTDSEVSAGGSGPEDSRRTVNRDRTDRDRTDRDRTDPAVTSSSR